MEKINFSGGEPFLQDRGEYLGQLVRFCKRDLRLPSVSIVSNGSLIRERWFMNYGELPLGASLAPAVAGGAAFPSTLGRGGPGLLGPRRGDPNMLPLISLQAVRWV